MTQFPPALALLALALAACAAPRTETPTETPTQTAAPAPASRFEPGGGTVREVSLAGRVAEALPGVWTGPYRPWDPSREAVTGPVAGTARLEIAPRSDSLAAGRMSFDHAAGPLPPIAAIGAVTLTGHVMMFNAHFIAFEQDGVVFLQADMPLPDGRFHRVRLTREAMD